MHKRKKLNTGVSLFVIGVICGILIVVATIHRSDIISDSERVVARIVYVDLSGDTKVVYVEYEAGDAMISSALNWTSGSMRVGQTVELFVSRQDPYRFVQGGILGWTAQLILFPFMAVFGGVGAMLSYKELRSRALHKWLMQHGTPVWANVLGVVPNWNIRVNRRPAMVLEATYRFMQYTSGPLDNIDMMHIGEHVKVLLHPENPSLYTFDIRDESDLRPENAPEMLSADRNLQSSSFHQAFPYKFGDL